MARYIAFLRGMNLGGRRITNDDLCGAIAEIGFSEVWAFLASGNVVFKSDVVFESEEADAAAVRARLEEGLRKGLGYEVPVFLRAEEDLRRLALGHPFEASLLSGPKAKPQVAFLRERPDAATRKATLALSTDHDRLAFGEGAELFWLPAEGVSGAQLSWKEVERLVGSTTVRTHRTIERLAKKLG